MDPAGLESMIRLFFGIGILAHSYVSWDGKGGGAYAEGPFSGMEMIQRFMDNAGDRECLQWLITDFTTGKRRTMLQTLISVGVDMNATYGSIRQDGLFDIGAGTGKMLEIEEDDYQHAIGAVNAMAVNYYSTLSHWCHDAGNATCALVSYVPFVQKVNSRLC